MNKQRFLRGDDFIFGDTWYKLSHDKKEILHDPTLSHDWVTYATVKTVSDQFVHVNARVFKMDVSYGIFFNEMKFSKP